ncbi:MAG: hypothetical protein MPN21_08665 [Thermoanaerobaculia bacterium]|nr:hypothetical protein [Thermoanaerobaculia bacterium]
MRYVRFLRAFAALIASFSCLAAPLRAVGTWTADFHHGEVASTLRFVPADAGHDSCWTAEVEPHQRHDDRRFEPQLGLRHHLHAAVAWSGTVSLTAPGLAIQKELPRFDTADGESLALLARDRERSPRQSRAPPQI